MEINQKTFPLYYNTALSLLRLNNITSLKKSKIIIIDFHYFYEQPNVVIQKYIDSRKVIYIDSTYELLENIVLEKLDKFSKLNSIHYFYNPREKNYNQRLLLKLIDKGLVCVPKYYFVDYANYYQPDTSATLMPNKSYLCLTGKVTPSRTFLIALLSNYNLLQHGHVSYFGEDYTTMSLNNQIIADYNNASFLSHPAKNIIKEELMQLKLPLVADTIHFTSEISHTKLFNVELYSSVDFVIVPETLGCTEFGNFFPTEKTAKCINLNKRFIPIANKGFLKKLKEYYKKNFNKDISNLTDWCDTSFDEMSSLEERITQIVKITAAEVDKYKNNLKEKS